MKSSTLLTLMMITACSYLTLHGQIHNNLQLPLSVNSNGAAPNSSAIVDVSATNKGLLIPRMSAAQRNNITNPARGLMVYVTNDDQFYYYDGSNWLPIASQTASSGPTGSWGLQPVTENAKVVANDDAAGDNFGFSVSVSGDYAVIGAPNDDDTASNSGSAYIFRRVGNSWVQEAKLTASDAASDDDFGTSVSISGDYAIIGAPYNDDGGSNSGSAYIFKRSGPSWTQEAKLTAQDAVAGDLFGWSVAISGDDVIIGSYLDDDDGNGSGSAYIYSRNGSIWVLQSKLTANDASISDLFGYSVSISGNYAAIGSLLDDHSNVSDAGSAYIFRRSNGTWSQHRKLIANDPDQVDLFGFSVSISGTTAVIGAYSDDDNGSNSGSAYVYLRSGNSWSQQAKLLASDGATSDQFGRSVAIDGAYIIVGARNNDFTGSDAGSAYIYERAGSTWFQTAKLTAQDGAASDNFGSSVGISGSWSIVGAYRDDDGGTNSGSTYFYRRQ